MRIEKDFELETNYFDGKDFNYTIINDNLLCIKDKENISEYTLINSEGNIIKTEDNVKIISHDDLFFLVLKDNLFKIVKYDGKEICKFNYIEEYFLMNDRLVIKSDNMLYFYDLNGNKINEVSIKNNIIKAFNDYYIILKDNNLNYELYDSNGNIITSIKDGNIKILDDKAIIYNKDNFYLINDKNDLLAETNKLCEIKVFENSFLKNKNKDITGKECLISKNKKTNFHTGILLDNKVNYGSVLYYDFKPFKNKRIFGIIDSNLNEKSLDKYDIVNKLEDGNYLVTKNNKDGLLDKNGNELLEPIYSNICLKNNIYLIFKDKKVGFYNKKNNLKVDSIYKSYIKLVFDKYLMGSNYFVDTDDNKKYKLPNLYSFINDNGYIIYKENNLFGVYDFINKRKITDPIYSFIRKKGNDKLIVSLNNKLGVIDINGNEIIPPYFKNIKCLTNNLFEIENDKIISKVDDKDVKYKLILLDDNNNILKVRNCISKDIQNKEYDVLSKELEKSEMLIKDNKDFYEKIISDYRKRKTRDLKRKFIDEDLLKEKNKVKKIMSDNTDKPV